MCKLYPWQRHAAPQTACPATKEKIPMTENVLQLDPRDNVLVALTPLAIGTVVRFGPDSCPVVQAVPAKHKMALVDLAPGDLIRMYGMVVGEAIESIPRG